MAMIWVGVAGSGTASTALPSPSKMTVSLQDIDSENAGRTASGAMARDRVCGGETAKRKIELEWSGLRESVARTLLQAISAEFFSVGYFDPFVTPPDPDPQEKGQIRVADFYAGDRKCEMFHYGGIKNATWANISVNFIEQ